MPAVSNGLSEVRVSILGVPLSCLGFEQALEVCQDLVRRREPGYVCFANVHSVTESTHLPALKDALLQAKYAFADGMPLVWVSRSRAHRIASRVCGPDFMRVFLLKLPGVSHGFLGGKTGQGEAIAAGANLKSAVNYCPPMRPYSPQNAMEDWKSLLAINGGVPPSVVWVGLGAPKQELWMATISPLAPQTLFFGVGAAFDFLTHTKRRAPEWMQRQGLEWLYRLIQEPGRLWRRYLVTNTKFLCFEFAERLGITRRDRP